MNDNPTAEPSCPEGCRVTNQIPMVHVEDVEKSVRFYSLLGFACDDRFSSPDGVTRFASLSSVRANLMLARSSGPIVPSQQAVLFYMYCQDVMSLRMHLLKNGLTDGGRFPHEGEPAEGPIPERNAVFRPTFPFYMPMGEIRVHDPDGYCILVGLLER